MDTEGSPFPGECPASHAKRIPVLKEQEESPSLECRASAASEQAGVLGHGHPQVERNLTFLRKSNVGSLVLCKLCIQGRGLLYGGSRLDVWIFPRSAGYTGSLSGAYVKHVYVPGNLYYL